MAEHEYEMILRETTVTTYKVRAKGEDRAAARAAAESGIVTSEEEVSVTSERVVDWPTVEQLPEPTEAEENSPTALYERAEAEIWQLLEKQATVVSGRHAQRKADALVGKVAEIEEGRLPDLCSAFTLTVWLAHSLSSDRDEIQLEGQVVYSVDYDRVYFLAATRPNNGSTRTGRIIEFGQEGEAFPLFFMGAIGFHLWSLAKDAANRGCELCVLLSDEVSHEVVLEAADGFSLPEVVDLADWQSRYEGRVPAPM